ncbi:hypothetical protein QQ44_00665 [Mycolicibacterium setense]|uniref:ESX-1 secretion-associated protein n=1 Tax=Mycolicibacterium setense TaxID=431269 RepID=A0ABR4Z0V2_9MYCO|nr:type VII secretion target [Mycolicibacterium setense]KHO28116.1 hypothetical protein QQ44_00665 [Mycolicibacterium setense]
MGSELKVDPAGLRSAAAAETAVSEAVAALGLGQPLSAAAAAMPGLRSGAACGQVSPVVDGAANALGSDLGAHANKLGHAANVFEQVDDASARQLIDSARAMD